MKHLLVVCLMFFLIGCQKSEKGPPPKWGFDVDGFPVTEQMLTQLFNETGIEPQLIVFYQQWSDKNQKNVDQGLLNSLAVIDQIHAIPCITWEPMLINGDKEQTIPYKDILEGHYDAYLASIVDQIKKYNKPVMIRFAHEMNLSRYHWGTSAEQFGADSSKIYISMYRYVVDYFRKNHVQNVLWVFCPNIDSIPKESWNKASLYYPGDHYVDIFGMDGYNWGIDSELAKQRNLNWTSPWRSFEMLFSSLYHELKQLSPHKPIYVFEVASVQRKGKPAKSEWIKEAIETARKWGIKGIVWFQVNKEEDWKIYPNDLRLNNADVSS